MKISLTRKEVAAKRLEFPSENFPEFNKFLDYFEKELNKGLVYINFITHLESLPLGKEGESFYSEVNRILAAPDVEDKEIL